MIAMQISRLRFLVVEDHSFQRWALCKLLADLGANEVFNASDGHSALDILRNLKVPVDIIVSDLDMPCMDGMEFLRHVGEAAQSVSVILLSALDRPLLESVGTMARFYGIPLLGTMEKPATAEKLTALIDRYRPPNETSSRLRKNDLQPTASEIAEGLKCDEFEPFFQPKVALKTGQLNGAEALARWRHPEMGPVEPQAFIKCMEANNLIEALTLTMLRKSAAACVGWLADGLDVTVSVNLSAVSLVDATFADRLTSVVAAEWLDPRHVILEITESAAATDMGMALENLSRLRMRGFGLSIDDYGTGYSSMQQLSRIAFTELKIDQSFIQNVSADGPGRIILESSLEMARRLNLFAVAEGVETREDLDLIRELGCDYAQGFFIARPMETERFGPWAKKWQERTVSI